MTPASPTPCNGFWRRKGTRSRSNSGATTAWRAPPPELFNVVITDLRLPGLNGLELVRQLHAAQPRLPIILITAFGTTETAIEAMKLGAYDYLLKPFDVPQIARPGSQSGRQQPPHVRTGHLGRNRRRA